MQGEWGAHILCILLFQVPQVGQGKRHQVTGKFLVSPPPLSPSQPQDSKLSPLVSKVDNGHGRAESTAELGMDLEAAVGSPLDSWLDLPVG